MDSDPMMNFGLMDILIAVAAVILFLIGSIILIPLILRTANLCSLQPMEVLIVGACKNDVLIMDANGNQRTKSEGFLYNVFDAHSLADIPKRKVLLTDSKGAIKGSVDDLGFIANGIMSIVPVIFISAALYLIALLIGIGGAGFFENLQILANADRWSWIRISLYGLAGLIAVMFVVNAFYSLSFKRRAPRDLEFVVPKDAVRPHDIHDGEVLDTFTEEVYLDRFQKNVYVNKWCIKLTGVYRFPIFPLFIANDEGDGKTTTPAPGTTLKFRVGDDYRLKLLRNGRGG